VLEEVQVPVGLDHRVVHRVQTLMAGHRETRARLEVHRHRQHLGRLVELDCAHRPRSADPSAASNTLAVILFPFQRSTNRNLTHSNFQRAKIFDVHLEPRVLSAQPRQLHLFRRNHLGAWRIELAASRCLGPIAQRLRHQSELARCDPNANFAGSIDGRFLELCRVFLLRNLLRFFFLPCSMLTIHRWKTKFSGQLTQNFCSSAIFQVRATVVMLRC